MQMWFTNIFSMQFVVNCTKFTCHGCHSFLFYYIFLWASNIISLCIYWWMYILITISTVYTILSSIFSNWLCSLIFMHLCLLHFYKKNLLYLFVSTEKSDSAPQGKVQNPNVDSYITSFAWCHSQVGIQQGKQTQSINIRKQHSEEIS